MCIRDRLTLVSLCGRAKVVSYESLMAEVELRDVRALEDLVIQAVENDLVSGKLFHKEHEFHVSWAVGRDVHADETDGLLEKLVSWKAHSESVVASMDDQVQAGIKQHQANKAAEAEKADELAKLKAEVIENLKNSKDSQGGLGFSMTRSRQGNRGRHGFSRR
eukprot:TRINITY_DN1445_c0_g1_i3.p1 TRINITY_DN1445_c0_g1~~TRINITY_DN1445_c0_g1_i3.p1  ORF type:complete len:163 (+),score=51.57 TRINITY_DN1445_c0_g1_i3:73-561(+)